MIAELLQVANQTISEKESCFELIKLTGPILKDLIPLFVSITGLFLIVWQINRQHRNSLLLQKKEFQKKLNLEIYERIASVINEAQTNLITINTTVLTLPGHIKNYWFQRESLGIDSAPPKERSFSINDQNSEAATSTSKLITEIELHEIALPGFSIFREEFSKQSELLRSYFMDFFVEIIRYLPTDVPIEKQISLKTSIILPLKPTDDAQSKIEKIARNYNEANADMLAFIHDLMIELQNHLLGNIFDNKLPYRQPQDLKFRVIRSAKKL